MLSFEQYFSPAGFSRSFYPKYIIQQSLNLDYMYFPPKILGIVNSQTESSRLFQRLVISNGQKRIVLFCFLFLGLHYVTTSV